MAPSNDNGVAKRWVRRVLSRRVRGDWGADDFLNLLRVGFFAVAAPIVIVGSWAQGDREIGSDVLMVAVAVFASSALWITLTEPRETAKRDRQNRDV